MIINIRSVAGALRGVIIPTRIQLLLLVIGIMADLLLEGIEPVLIGSGLRSKASRLTTEIKAVSS